MRILSGVLAAFVMGAGAALGLACMCAALYFSAWSCVAIARAVAP